MTTPPRPRSIQQLVKAIGGQITSKKDRNYNCIAWSVGEKGRWIWPDEGTMVPRYDANNGRKGNHWPFEGRDSSLPSFLEFYREIHGFAECSTPEPETAGERERVVLYGFVRGTTTIIAHASRQRADGTWESKLGEEEDIIHPTAEDLVALYGCPDMVFLERPRPASAMPRRRVIRRSG
jgi:hypothetical protein